MSRPHGVQTGHSAGKSIDATICAHSGTSVERQYTIAALPRLQDAGALEGSQVTARFAFSLFEGRVAIGGTLAGVLRLTCQRCMKPFGFGGGHTVRLFLRRKFAFPLHQIGSA